MPVHPAVARRFALLEGMTSFEQLMADPELEARFHAFMQHRDAAPAPAVTTREVRVVGPHGPVPVRIYEPTHRGPDRPCLVWLHGGAFMMGDLDMPEADRTAREVCVRSGAVVVSVDYRLAVDGVTYPVPLNDCVAAIRWARDTAPVLGIDASRISVGGASAGACLAAGATLRLRDEDAWSAAALLLCYVNVHARLLPASATLTELMTAVPDVLRFTHASTEMVTVNYLGGPVTSADGYALPALAELEGLCPTLVLNAEYDDLRPSGEAFTAALAQAGVDVQQVLVRGALHGFCNLPADIEPVGRAFALLADTVSAARHLHPVTDPPSTPVPS